MNEDTKKKIIVGLSFGLSIGVAGIFCIISVVIAAIFIKNKLYQKRFQPLQRQAVINILKKTRKQNFRILKKVAFAASKIIAQMKMNKPDLQLIRSVVEGPESYLKIAQTFESNYELACKEFNTDYSNLQESIQYYSGKQDKEIQKLVEQIEKDYETSLTGKLPELKVTVPPSLTKQKIYEISKKLALKRYLLQIDIFRKIRGKSQQQLTTNRQLLASIPSPEQEEQKLLQQQGLGTNDQPASYVYTAAVVKFKNDLDFRQKLEKFQKHYMKIFARYQSKIQQNKITENELNELEDQLIYTECS